MAKDESTLLAGESDEDGPAGAGAQEVAASKKKRKPKKKGAANAGGSEDKENEGVAEAALAAEPAPAEQSGEEEAEGAEGGAAASAKKKKKKKKKGAAEAQAAADEEALAEALAETAAEGAAAGGAHESEDEAEAGEAPAADAPADAPADAAAAGKKKRKKKKKGAAGGAAEPEEESEGEAPAPAAAEESEDEGPEAAATAKKKKRRPKKKGGSGGGQGAPEGIWAIPDEEFDTWAKAALAATLNGSEKMSKEELMKPPKPFWGYKYSGSLRPAFVSPQMKMPPGWFMPDYATEPEGVSHSERNGPKEVPILEGKELETMREACRLGREVLDIAARFMREGITGDEIDRVVYQACVDRKIYPSPLNYYRFQKSVCVSPNEVICHGIPDSRPIEEGDIVNLDVSIYHQGFHADLNETFFVGECDEDSHRLVRTAYCALHAAAQQIRPGTFYRDLGNYIHAEAAKSNCAVVTTYCGHGVGQLFHGPPKVPHYRKNKAVGIMKPGHVFTVEPMINLGSNGGDRLWPDNWTAVTRDGKRSAQFEHTFLVTETGLEVLTCRTKTDRSAMPPYDAAMFQC